MTMKLFLKSELYTPEHQITFMILSKIHTNIVILLLLLLKTRLVYKNGPNASQRCYAKLQDNTKQILR